MEEKGTNTALRGQVAPPPRTVLFTLSDEEDAGGMRPGALPELPEPQDSTPTTDGELWPSSVVAASGRRSTAARRTGALLAARFAVPVPASGR